MAVGGWWMGCTGDDGLLCVAWRAACSSELLAASPGAPSRSCACWLPPPTPSHLSPRPRQQKTKNTLEDRHYCCRMGSLQPSPLTRTLRAPPTLLPPFEQRTATTAAAWWTGLSTAARTAATCAWCSRCWATTCSRSFGALRRLFCSWLAEAKAEGSHSSSVAAGRCWEAAGCPPLSHHLAQLNPHPHSPPSHPPPLYRQAVRPPRHPTACGAPPCPPGPGGA